MVNDPMNQSSVKLLRLLDQARRGDMESLGLLLSNYFRYLRSISNGHLDERIRARVSASDVIQETLLEAHRDFQKFVGTSIQEFTGWLRKILFNNMARAVENHLTAAKRDVRKQRSLDEKIKDTNHSADRFAGFLQVQLTSVSSAHCRKESLRHLADAITLLPDDYREVIQLRHFEGLTFPEIALRLDRNQGATRMLWFRAVERLRGLILREH